MKLHAIHPKVTRLAWIFSEKEVFHSGEKDDTCLMKKNYSDKHAVIKLDIFPFRSAKMATKGWAWNIVSFNFLIQYF